MAPASKAQSNGQTSPPNPIGLDGLDFMEFASGDKKVLEPIFKSFGFELLAGWEDQKAYLWRQGDANFIINKNPKSFSASFMAQHGPCISSTGFRVKDAKFAFEESIRRGARPYKGDRSQLLFDVPVIYGIGESLIYFIDQYGSENSLVDKKFGTKGKKVIGKGFLRVDHMTNNVPAGEMQKWCDFYEDIFGFEERRYFNIRGAKTGLISKVMISPCNKINIPINEPSDSKSQIQEYLNEYHGSGIQHVALLTTDICKIVDAVKKEGVEFLDTMDAYFDLLPERLPNVVEPIKQLRELKILADGDEKGYLLQIFTKNLIGPIFFEVIQRKNHDGFGEGNFQALFDAMERDQEQRGVL